MTRVSSGRSWSRRCKLTAELPYLGVTQGEAKVRQVLRNGGPFTEVWRGRWQAGHAAPALLRYLAIQAARAEAA